MMIKNNRIFYLKDETYRFPSFCTAAVLLLIYFNQSLKYYRNTAKKELQTDKFNSANLMIMIDARLPKMFTHSEIFLFLCKFLQKLASLFHAKSSQRMYDSLSTF